MLQVKSYLSIIVVQLMIISAFFVQSGIATFQLSLTDRATGSNVLTLQCRNDSGALERRAKFFLNNTELTTANYPSFMDRNAQPDVVTFQINRWLEGMYSCGVGQVKSDPISFIAYSTDDANIICRENNCKHFTVVGETAVIPCAVSPGALIHYYHATWRNGSRTIFRQSLPSQRNSTTFPDSVDPRYRLDPMNLSLIIDNVRRSDSIQDYHCVLQVVDPENGYTDEYEVASHMNISLTVLSPPSITALTPREDTVRQGENAIISCKAQGYPLPKISWMHNDRIVIENHPDYFVSQSIIDANTMVISNLRIFSVTAAAGTGNVTCITSANSPQGSGITLANHAQSIPLTVLGIFRKFDVLISTGGDVIFSLELPTEYFQPIHLFLKYTNEDDPNESYNRTTEIGFLNTKSVQYMEYSSQVYYERFQIKAALVSGYREVLGPLYAVPGVYDTTTTTFCESGFNPHHTITFGVITALLIILSILLVVIIFVIIMKKDSDFLNYQKNMSDKVLKLTIENTQLQNVFKESSDLTEPPTSRPQKFDTSASARAKESRSLISEPQSSIDHEVRPQNFDTSTSTKAKGISDLSGALAPPPIEHRLDSDDSRPSTPPAREKRSERRQVKDKAHRGAPKLRMRKERSTEKRTSEYKNNPVYPDMKKALKDTNLSKRKYKMAKKQLQEDCERLLRSNEFYQ